MSILKGRTGDRGLKGDKGDIGDPVKLFCIYFIDVIILYYI